MLFTTALLSVHGPPPVRRQQLLHPLLSSELALSGGLWKRTRSTLYNEFGCSFHVAIENGGLLQLTSPLLPFTM